MKFATKPIRQYSPHFTHVAFGWYRNRWP